MKTNGNRMSEEPVTLDVEKLYSATGQAKLADLQKYEQAVMAQVAPGARVILTGRGPIWLYLRIAHLLHGRANVLSYLSPPAGIHEPLEIFNHNPH
jgi:hypothetical protein